MPDPNSLSPATVPPEPGVDAPSRSPWLSPTRALVFIGIYFLLQTILRVVVSDSAELDESEQLLWTQDWAWGYGSDPPLYTWLQILVFKLCGPSILGLALLKNVLLFAGFYFTYLAAKTVTARTHLGVVAMFALLLFPQVTWESQRDLTHSVLATALAAATFYLVARIQNAPGSGLFVWLGVALGLGTLSKYSYDLFALALGIALLSTRPSRRIFACKWIALTAGVFLLLTAWHFYWVLSKPAEAFSRPGELIRASRGWHLAAWARGFFSLIKCAVMLSSCAVVAFALIFRRKDHPELAAPELQLWRQLIERTLWSVAGIAAVVVLAFAIELKDRRFQPVVFLGAILAAILVRDRVSAASAKRLYQLALVVAALMVVILPGIPLAAAITRRPTRLNAPYSALSLKLKTIHPDPPVIVAESRLVGGNLRLSFPNSTVIAPEFWALPASTNLPWLVVWDATKREDPSAALSALVSRLRGVTLSTLPVAYVDAAFKYTQAKRMRLGCVLVSSRVNP